jgi:hypothetical protein
MNPSPPTPGKAEFTVGHHHVRIEPPIFLVENHGPVALEEFDQLMGHMRRAIAEQGVCYFLMNVADTPAPSPAVRKRMQTQDKLVGLRATIGFGAPPLLLLFSRVIRRGMELLRPDELPSFVMLRDEAEARAFVAADLLARPLPGQPPRPPSRI